MGSVSLGGGVIVGRHSPPRIRRKSPSQLKIQLKSDIVA